MEIRIELPAKFVELCASQSARPSDVLQGLIADVCRHKQLCVLSSLVLGAIDRQDVALERLAAAEDEFERITRQQELVERQQENVSNLTRLVESQQEDVSRLTRQILSFIAPTRALPPDACEAGMPCPFGERSGRES